MKKLLTLIFLFSVLCSFGQEEKKYDKVISYSEFEEMLRTGTIYIEDTYIKMDRKIARTKKGTLIGDVYVGKDAKYYESIYDENGDLKGARPLGIENLKLKDTEIRNCKFDQVWFKNCEFSGLSFEECEIEMMMIENCTSKADINFFYSTLKDGWNTISNCVINGKISLEEINTKNNNFRNIVELELDNNTIKEGIYVSGNFKSVTISNNRIFKKINIENTTIYNSLNIEQDTLVIETSLFRAKSPDWHKYRNYYYDKNYNPSFISINQNEINQLEISNNIFSYRDTFNFINNVYNYSFEGSNFNEFEMKNEKVERVNFNNTSISKSINLDSIIINKDFSAINMELPEYNLSFSWNLLRNKLNFSLTDSTNYEAKSVMELSDEKMYNSFITSYKKFFSVFKNKGDLKSANACYAEMKDVETRRLKYLSETEGGVDNYLNYQLNVFLKYFAEYGTSPIKSVKISGWVILIFSFFYFFFYSEWDKINRKFLMDKGEMMLSYFKSEQKLEELYTDKYKEDLSTFTNFKQNLKESKAQVPFFFMLFLKPLYWVAVIKHRFNSFLYKRVEFLQGKWSDLTSGKKFLLGTMTFFAIITYGLYLIAIRSLNSFILSINTFTTLGFGDIPVVGISRYVAILEGFLGWFLLSIFSVSLISQILQN